MPEPLKRSLLTTAAFLLDMDGTVYLDGRLIDGVDRFIRFLEDRHITYLFLTNNSSRSAVDYAARLRSLGIPASTENILTSGDATAAYLQHLMPGARLYVVGTPSLRDVFRTHGFSLIHSRPDAVVLGFDTGLTYAKLRRLCDFVRQGLPFYATHPDINCPTLTGYMPDTGAMIAFVKASTGREPDLIIGKPNRYMVESAAAVLNIPMNSLAVVGDRLYTDIAMGKAANIPSVLVLSGETKLEDLALTPYEPDLVVKDLGKLSDYLQEVYEAAETP